MTSVSNIPGLNIEDFSQVRYVNLAANWFRNEIYRAKVLANNGTEEGMLEGKNLLTLLLQFVTGTYVSRFNDPMTHQLLTKMVEGYTFQTFVFTRLNLLGLIPEFSREKSHVLLALLLGTFTTPAGTENPVFQSAEPNVKALEIFFKENHWMLLLLFAVASFNLKSFDVELFSN